MFKLFQKDNQYKIIKKLLKDCKNGMYHMSDITKGGRRYHFVAVKYMDGTVGICYPIDISVVDDTQDHDIKLESGIKLQRWEAMRILLKTQCFSQKMIAKQAVDLIEEDK